jgi:hypothetical protein
MIDIGSKDLLSFAKAAGIYPGGAVHVSTLHRYRLRGVGGQKLEAVFVSGRWRTSTQAIERFVIAVNEARSSTRASSSSSTAFLAAETTLEKEGF